MREKKKKVHSFGQKTKCMNCLKTKYICVFDKMKKKMFGIEDFLRR